MRRKRKTSIVLRRRRRRKSIRLRKWKRNGETRASVRWREDVNNKKGIELVEEYQVKE